MDYRAYKAKKEKERQMHKEHKSQQYKLELTFQEIDILKKVLESKIVKINDLLMKVDGEEIDCESNKVKIEEFQQRLQILEELYNRLEDI